MFDERHLQMADSYAKIDEYFLRTVIYPLLDWASDKLIEKIDSELDKRLKLELGQETYVMSPDENGGWKWTKFDRQTNEYVQPNPQEQQEVEELLTDVLTPVVDSTQPIPEPSNTTAPSTSQPTPESSATTAPSTSQPTPESSATTAPSTSQPTPESSATTAPSTSQPTPESSATTAPSTSQPTPESSATTAPSASQPTPEPPENIDLNHWQELIQGSAIAPSLAELNFQSLHIDPIEQEHRAWEYLFYSDQLERLNTGRLKQGLLYTYAHIEHGGWWCSSGVNPTSFADLKAGEKPPQKIWGCYKPNQPRIKPEKEHQTKPLFPFLAQENAPDKLQGKVAQPKKLIKYEHPPKTETSIFLLEVPNDIAEHIYLKSEVSPSHSDRQSGFWYCVWKHNIPITITEGAKKAACLLSQGEVAIGVPGIYNGYRKQDDGITPLLHPELAVFATKDRHFKICFDSETKPKTKRNINIATYRTGKLLEMAGSTVSVVQLPGPDKGVDDLIVAHGADAYFKISAASLPLDQWWSNNTPPDLRLTIILKDGTVKTLYEQKGDGSVNLLPDNELHSHTAPQTQPSPTKSDFSLPTMPPLPTMPKIPIMGSLPPNLSPQQQDTTSVGNSTTVNHHHNQSHSPDASLNWAKQQEVTLYKPSLRRKKLEAQENDALALAAVALVKKYGTSVLDKNHQPTNQLVYQADAFIIHKNGENYSILRRHSRQELITFRADPLGKVKSFQILQNSDSQNPSPHILPIERQEFLLVADYLQSGKPLPSPDEDPRKIAQELGSLAIDGTHKILESFKQKEVIQILTHTLKTFNSDDLVLGNYRILYQPKNQDTSVLQLLKTEHTGITRVAASFELNRTLQGMTHQVKTLALTELDLNKLRLLAQKLDLPPSIAAQAPTNPHATRDIELPVHPEIAKRVQHLERESEQEQEEQGGRGAGGQGRSYNSYTYTPPHLRTSGSSSPASPASPASPTSLAPRTSASSQSETAVFPIHPELARHWQVLENTHRWLGLAEQGSNEFRSLIQNNLGLTISEQRELYFVLQLQAQGEIRTQGITDITLSPLNDIIQDLRQQSPIHQTANSPEQACYTQLPLHPELAQHWQDLEINKKWVGVADQWNYPLRQKLKQTGKLTIGEQRELYQKLLVQSAVEQNRNQKTDISLPPLSKILQDLMAERKKVIELTYSSKIEIRTPQPPQNTHSKSTSINLEF